MLQPNSKALVWGGKWGVCSLWNHCPHLFHSFLGKDFLYILTGAKQSCSFQDAIEENGKRYPLTFSPLSPSGKHNSVHSRSLRTVKAFNFPPFSFFAGFSSGVIFDPFFPSMTSTPHMALPADGFWKWLHPPTSSASLSHDVTFRTSLPIFASKACVLAFLFIKK